jgi:hypothetical protein
MRRIVDSLRYHARRRGVIPVAVLAALGAGVAAGALTAGSGSSPASAPAAATTTTTPPSPAPAASSTRHVRHGVRGRVTAISATSWTVQTAAGQTVTVEITSSTHFGPRVVPTKIAVGDQIVVIGSGSGATVTASRIGMAPHLSAPAAALTPTTTTVPSTAPAG